jgi:4-hydroxy-tetrahydrodipicolinate synthase
MLKKFKGTGVALITPFHSNGSVDFTSLQKLLEYNISGGVDYFVVMGTTAESACLNADEKIAVLEAVKEINDNRLPLVLGIGGNNTREVVRQLRETNLDQIDGILSVSPYYNKPTQDGIYAHYRELALNTSLPIILYNVPGRTSSNMSAQTTLRLAHDFDNIAAVKEASGDLVQIMEIIHEKPAHFGVISGDDALTMPIILSGGEGVISVVGQVKPEIFTEMVRMAIKKKVVKAQSAHYTLLKLTDLLFREGNPAGAKAALKHLGVTKEHLRLPLVGVSKELNKKIKEELQNLEKYVG